MFTLSTVRTILYLKSPNFPASLVHGISLRLGGISCGPYASLNMGLHVQDNAEKVLQNREQWAQAFGIDAASVVVGEQVHGSNVHVVTKKDWGKGFLAAKDAIPACDGLISQEPGTCLMSFYADCVPLFFYHPPTGAVGLSHAGWKGTLLQIGRKTVAAMAENFGADPAELRAAIGPSIGPCCYEVGEDLADKFVDVFGTAVIKRSLSGRLHLNLWLANTLTLVWSGVKPANISRADLCTACHPGLLYSHRFAQGRTGRMAAFIQVPRGL